MTYWWNEIGDRISLFNLADICPKAWFFYPKSLDHYTVTASTQCVGIEKPSLGKKLSLSSFVF